MAHRTQSLRVSASTTLYDTQRLAFHWPRPFSDAKIQSDGSQSSIFGTPWQRDFSKKRHDLKTASGQHLGKVHEDAPFAIAAWLNLSMNAVTQLRGAWNFRDIDRVKPMTKELITIAETSKALSEALTTGSGRKPFHLRQHHPLETPSADSIRYDWFHTLQAFADTVKNPAPPNIALSPLLASDWRFQQAGVNGHPHAKFNLVCANTGKIAFELSWLIGDSTQIVASALFGKVIADTVRTFRSMAPADAGLAEKFVKSVTLLGPALPRLTSRAATVWATPRTDAAVTTNALRLVESAERLAPMIAATREPDNQLWQLLSTGRNARQGFYKDRAAAQEVWPYQPTGRLAEKQAVLAL